MRKTISILFFIACASISPLYAQQAQISLTGQSPCAGFSASNTATAELTTLPNYHDNESVILVVDWYAVHDVATKKWNTNLTHRRIPTPWAGRYNVFAIVRYVYREDLKPFRSFKTNAVSFSVSENCANTDSENFHPRRSYERRHSAGGGQ